MNAFFTECDRLNNELGRRPTAAREGALVPRVRSAAVVAVAYLAVLAIAVALT